MTPLKTAAANTPEAQELRAAFIGARKSRSEIAAAWGCHPDTVDNWAKRLKLSFTTIFGERYYVLSDFHDGLEAIAASRTDPEAPRPRRRGRPPKVAVASV